MAILDKRKQRRIRRNHLTRAQVDVGDPAVCGRDDPGIVQIDLRLGQLTQRGADRCIAIADLAGLALCGGKRGLGGLYSRLRAVARRAQ